MEKNQKRLIAKVKTTNGTFGTPVSTDLGAVYEKLRSGDNEERVRKIAFRATVSALSEGEREGLSSIGDALPYLLFSATFGKGGLEDVPNLKQLTTTLKQCGFLHGANCGIRGWYAVLK